MSDVRENPLTAVSVEVSHDTESAYTDAAKMFVATANDAVARHSKFTVALSGGSTPKKLYEMLASPPWRDQIPWDRTEFFWSDERFVPATDPASNYNMTHKALIAAVPLPPQNVHRVITENIEPQAAAKAYEDEIRRVVPKGSNGVPEFDLMLLGLGTNGHTASIFPHQPAIYENERLIVAEYIEEVKMTRITFTAPLINASRDVLFIALGADKTDVVQEVVMGPFDPDRLPAQLVKPEPGDLTWILDPQSAARIPHHLWKV
jgi:6-phosphogluconolactonase